MSKTKTRHFKIHTRVGASSWSSTAITLPKGGSEQHEVVVTPYGGMPKRTQVFCVRSSGAAAEYNPAPPDAWDYDFGLIDCSSTASSCTTSRSVRAGQAPGAVILQVKELHVDDGLPSPRVDSISLNIQVTVP
jgi:hypothetical protein